MVPKSLALIADRWFHGVMASTRTLNPAIRVQISVEPLPNLFSPKVTINAFF